MSSWRRSGVLAILIITTFLAFQISLPASRLGIHDSAPRFGWQMFSTAREAPAFVVVTESGEIAVELDDYVAGARGDLDMVHLVPPHLCEVVSGAVRIIWDSGMFVC